MLHMPQPLKPHALRPGDAVRVISLASPVKEDRVEIGCEELSRLGYIPKLDRESVFACDGLFAGCVEARLKSLQNALSEPETRAIFCTRGGYGSNYLLEGLRAAQDRPKLFVGFSDLTSLQIFLWQKYRWVTLYGPMVAAGLDGGAGGAHGYDRESLSRALTETKQGWQIDLDAESITGGTGEGTLLGGCLTLVQTTLGTPWELETDGAILILEDRGMKPHQVDRSLMHLKQAGKFQGVNGIILGDFPECDAFGSAESIKEIARRVLAPLKIPVIWGAPIGHTSRPMLTIPLGVRGRISATGPGRLEILEPSVIL
jgi:muramoyltetrapeptide carboxypeptidase